MNTNSNELRSGSLFIQFYNRVYVYYVKIPWIKAAISRENTKLKSRESQPEPIYHQSDISHLASKLKISFLIEHK